MSMKCLALTLGVGAALGAVAILMMPQDNATRKLAQQAADKAECAANKATCVLQQKRPADLQKNERPL